MSTFPTISKPFPSDSVLSYDGALDVRYDRDISDAILSQSGDSIVTNLIKSSKVYKEAFEIFVK